MRATLAAKSKDDGGQKPKRKWRVDEAEETIL
jgi:hypothetical protein